MPATQRRIDRSRVRRREVDQLRGGEVSPCLFYPKDWGVCGLVDGDDFVLVKCAKKPTMHMSMNLKVKVAMAGSDHKPMRMLKLNRSIRCAPEGITHESGHRHAARFVGELALKLKNVVVTPALNESRNAQEGPARINRGEPVVQHRLGNTTIARL